MGGVALAKVASKVDVKGGLCRCVAYVHSSVISLVVLHAIADKSGVVVDRLRRDMLRVHIHYRQPIFGQGVNQFKLCTTHILHREECLKVHLAYGSHNANRGVYQVANLLDVAYLLCSHLHDKYLMVGLQMLSYGADNAQRSVEVARGHQHIVFLREYAIQIMLC